MPDAPALTRAEEAREDGQVYGIIDPDYARVFTVARCIAWSEGYAMVMHGSFTRDLDLLAVPWADEATDAEHLVRRIACALDDLDLLIKDPKAPSQATQKPHGRLAWTMTFKAFGDPRFIDISVMPRAARAEAEVARLKGAVADLEEVLADKRRLAREIDVAMHGEEGAAQQPSLCDLVTPARDLRKTVARLTAAVETAERERDEARHTNRDLHRRAQKAEAFKLRHRGGFSYVMRRRLQDRRARRAAEARVAVLEAVLRPFAAIKPSSFYSADGTEAEGYRTFLHEGPNKEFTGTDLAAARAALGASHAD